MQQTKHLNNKALERGGEVDTVDSCVRGNHNKDLIPALFFRKQFNKYNMIDFIDIQNLGFKK